MTTVPISPEEGPSVVLELLYQLKVRDAMTREVITAAPATSLREIQRLMRDHAITGIPIEEGGRLQGIVSIGDVIEALDAGTMDEPAEKAMIHSVVTLDEDMPLSIAVTYFDRYKFGRFPILDRSGKLSGILTAKDVITRLLIALNEEIGRLEKRMAERQSEPEGPMPVMEMCFGVSPLDFSKAGDVSARFKKALVEKGCGAEQARKIAIAAYELELNQVIHSKGGSMRMRVYDDTVEIKAIDEGPGIPDVEAAMREGFSTANEWVRSLGFGAGMGLPNVKRVSDEFEIYSAPGKGTTVKAVIHWTPAPIKG